MLESVLPIDEEIRLATLRGLNILDTPAEERFDSLTRIAQRCLDVPIALITLVDSNRQWFKSKQGLETIETPRSISFCGHAIHADDAFVISDSTLDSRFADNPLVMGAPYVRFYAGQPLKARNGSRLGTLCVIDTKPRQLSQADLDLLRDLGALVECELNLRDTLKLWDTMLFESAAIMSATVDTAMDAVVQMDAQGTISGWNHQAETIFGWTREEALGIKLHETIIPPQYRQAHVRGMEHFLATSEGPVLTKRIEISALHRDGHEFPIELSITPLKIAGKYEFSAFLRDITERKQNEKKLELAASVFTHAREGIVITDAAGTIVDVNTTFTHITGYLRAEALGQDQRIRESDWQSPEFYAAIHSSLAENGHWSGEIWNRRKNGEVYAEMQTVSAVRDAKGAVQHYVCLFTDITSQKEQQQQLEHIAHFDALTSLPNRVLLADRLHQAMLQCQRRGNTLAVAYLDLDGFKQVNDKHGHGVGDEMLVLLSQRIKEVLREGDTLARLLQAASQPVTVGDVVLTVSASIGVTRYPQDGADADLLLRYADQAMYIAKDSGKNRHHFFDVASASAVQTQRESLQNIAHALEQHDFLLYYQPKVNMQTGAVVGAEALVRWQHPVRGLLAPAAFLPIIEDHPLSVER